MSIIISAATHKGGTGKTTTIVNLAASYANINKRVLVIDLDPQMNATQLLTTPGQQYPEEKTIAQAINNSLPLEEVRIQTSCEGVDLLAASPDLNDIRDRMKSDAEQAFLLDDLLESPVIEEYDLILIDLHGSLDCLMLSALKSSDYYLIPMFAERSSAEGLQMMVDFVARHRRLLSALRLLGIVITRFNPKNATNVVYKDLIYEMGKKSNIPVFQNIIPVSNAVSGADAEHKTLLQYRRTLPITEAYTALAGEMLPLLSSRRRGRVPQIRTAAIAEARSAFEMLDVEQMS
ncbi:MAG TPA: ParA family protein [Blastocatellia bacterium]|nr:ParA family protein [Blastocatellia bacterium]